MRSVVRVIFGAAACLLAASVVSSIASADHLLLAQNVSPAAPTAPTAKPEEGIPITDAGA